MFMGLDDQNDDLPFLNIVIFQFAEPPNLVRNSGTSPAPASCQAPSRLPYIAPTTPAAELETGFFP